MNKWRIIKKIVFISMILIVLACAFQFSKNEETSKYDKVSVDEYTEMSSEERLEFQESFDSFEEFDEWVRENIE